MWRVTLHLASKGLAERNSVGGRHRPGGGVHARLDRGLPSPASLLFKKRRHVMLPLSEEMSLSLMISTARLRWRNHLHAHSAIVERTCVQE
eukprot:2213463-Amphidinium_carterae.1